MFTDTIRMQTYLLGNTVQPTTASDGKTAYAAWNIAVAIFGPPQKIWKGAWDSAFLTSSSVCQCCWSTEDPWGTDMQGAALELLATY